MLSIIWSSDASDELLEILAYQKEKYGLKRAEDIYTRIHEKILVTELHPDAGRVVPELEIIGITNIRELIENPWRVLYEAKGNIIEVLSVIDGRRNFEDILYRKILDRKLI